MHQVRFSRVFFHGNDGLEVGGDPFLADEDLIVIGNRDTLEETENTGRILNVYFVDCDVVQVEEDHKALYVGRCVEQNTDVANRGASISWIGGRLTGGVGYVLEPDPTDPDPQHEAKRTVDTFDSLDDRYFDDAQSKWTMSGFQITNYHAEYSGGTATLKQESSNLARSLKPDTTYTFSYYITGASGSPVAYISGNFASTYAALPVNYNGIHTVVFKSAAAGTIGSDFEITATGTGEFNIDEVSLREYSADRRYGFFFDGANSSYISGLTTDKIGQLENLIHIRKMAHEDEQVTLGPITPVSCSVPSNYSRKRPMISIGPEAGKDHIKDTTVRGAFYTKTSEDANGSTATTPFSIWRSDRKSFFRRVFFVPEGNLVSGDTNYAELSLYIYKSDGTLNRKSTSVTKTIASGGTGDWTAHKPVELTLPTIDMISAGGSISFGITKQGSSGVRVPAGSLILELSDWRYY